MERIKILQGDITNLEVDAIVNAANTSLLGGGGVDGAIHQAAGPELKKYNKSLNGCETGEAKLSPGFKLPAKHVISTVGPVWKGGDNQEKELLSNCYYNSLKIAEENNINSVAFPAISTGVYGFPFEEATKIALNTVRTFLNHHQSPKEVIFIFFSEDQMEIAKSIFN